MVSIGAILTFLGQGFLYPEDKKFLKKGSTALAGLAHDLGISIPFLEEEPDLAAHQSEFVKLFIASPQGVSAPPYGSYYINSRKLLFQEGTEQVLNYYEKAGLHPPDGPEPPDHLAFELFLAGYMADNGFEALLQDFLSHHLLIWYPQFEKKLFEASPSNWFQALGLVTEELLKQLSSMEGGSYEKA